MGVGACVSQLALRHLARQLGQRLVDNELRDAGRLRESVIMRTTLLHTHLTSADLSRQTEQRKQKKTITAIFIYFLYLLKKECFVANEKNIMKIFKNLYTYDNVTLHA